MQKKNKPDRRIQRTKQALRHALLELIKEKGYDSIPVEEITQKANLSRATFYLHYKDKEGLLVDIFSEIADERRRLLSDIPISAWAPNLEASGAAGENDPIPPSLFVFQHVADNYDLYRILLNSEKADRIFERIRKILTQSIIEFMQAKAQNDPIPILFEVPIELLAAYYSGALLGCVDWWLEGELSHSPEEMSHMFQRLFYPGARKILGTPGTGPD